MTVTFLTKRPNPVIRANEGVVFKTVHNEYHGRTGPFYWADIIDYADENTLAIFHDEEGRFRDLTEDAASFWLDKYQDTTPDDDVPAYVKNSKAWDIYCEDYPAPKPLSAHAVYYHNSAGRRL